MESGMAPSFYEFETQLRQGESGELFLDDYFCRWYQILPASPEQQREGIDRIFIRRDNDVEYAIEYKCDKTAARTGNAFIETISVDSQNKLGWAHYCQADFIIYFVDGCGPAYVISPERLRAQLASWTDCFQRRSIPNKGYNTVGLLTPLGELERLARVVLPISRDTVDLE